MRRFVRRCFRYLLLAVAGAVLLAEEALWRLSAVFALLGRLPGLRSIERWVEGLPPLGALAVFAIPSVALAPVKMLALYWVAGGHPALGIGTILAAKVTGTAFVARLYQLTEPRLLTFGWFRWASGWVKHLRAEAYRLWAESAAGRMWRRILARRPNWLGRRFRAARAALAGK